MEVRDSGLDFETSGSDHIPAARVLQSLWVAAAAIASSNPRAMGPGVPATSPPTSRDAATTTPPSPAAGISVSRSEPACVPLPRTPAPSAAASTRTTPTSPPPHRTRRTDSTRTDPPWSNWASSPIKPLSLSKNLLSLSRTLDDEQGQKMWRINQRIVKLIVELMRIHDSPESLSASDLLLRATDGMLVDGEACTLPQLELLEATAKAIQPMLEWGGTGLTVSDGLSNLLKCRLPAYLPHRTMPATPPPPYVMNKLRKMTLRVIAERLSEEWRA
ncbi:hypothetical protein DVH24_022027 [Malus domestica]|uniref:Uncharacterized protein n=1 Tax=Malus domestica TaxID=3750 RepID=A0A498IYH4_MALDO|nr:hypothetical protein DVH24_022025 [Malus domestica]RXH86754.1 hypothetical protein DVH24_022027 [Malus domestica]